MTDDRLLDSLADLRRFARERQMHHLTEALDIALHIAVLEVSNARRPGAGGVADPGPSGPAQN